MRCVWISFEARTSESRGSSAEDEDSWLGARKKRHAARYWMADATGIVMSWLPSHAELCRKGASPWRRHFAVHLGSRETPEVKAALKAEPQCEWGQGARRCGIRLAGPDRKTESGPTLHFLFPSAPPRLPGKTSLSRGQLRNCTSRRPAPARLADHY